MVSSRKYRSSLEIFFSAYSLMESFRETFFFFYVYFIEIAPFVWKRGGFLSFV